MPNSLVVGPATTRSGGPTDGRLTDHYLNERFTPLG